MTASHPSMRDNRLKVAVIGGGITGLAAAHRIVRQNTNAEVAIFEASDRLGGMIRTERSDGYLLEYGPDAFITNKPGAVQLCEELGFTPQLIPTDNTFRRSLVLRNGRPLPVPDGFMLMAPAKPWAIATTRVLSIAGKLRLLQEAFVRRKTEEDDESLADFVRRRFGRQALDRLVQPLVGGIYTADPEKLSLKATLPRFLDMEREFGSVIKATLAQQKKTTSNTNSGSGARYGLFATPKEGLSSLITCLEQNLVSTNRVTVQTGMAVTAVSKAVASSTDQNWTVKTEDRTSKFDSVILATSAYRAASLLGDTEFSELSSKLSEIEYASSVIVLTGHQLADFAHPLDAFGLVVPTIERRRVLAVSFTSRKFPGRAPDGCVLCRTFVGGAMQPELLEHSDDEISDIVSEELTDIFGMQAKPQFCKVVRYNNAMPQYHVGHLERVDRIDQLLGQHQGLFLAGNAYRGAGIPDSIASGRAAADNVLQLQSQNPDASKTLPQHS